MSAVTQPTNDNQESVMLQGAKATPAKMYLDYAKCEKNDLIKQMKNFDSFKEKNIDSIFENWTKKKIAAVHALVEHYTKHGILRKKAQIKRLLQALQLAESVYAPLIKFFRDIAPCSTKYQVVFLTHQYFKDLDKANKDVFHFQIKLVLGSLEKFIEIKKPAFKEAMTIDDQSEPELKFSHKLCTTFFDEGTKFFAGNDQDVVRHLIERLAQANKEIETEFKTIFHKLAPL